jgi:hypothetical protein
VAVMVSRFSINGETMAVWSLVLGDNIAKSTDLQPVRATKPNAKQSDVMRFMFSSLLEEDLKSFTL